MNIAGLKGSWGLLPLRLIIGVGFLMHGLAKWNRGPENFAKLLAWVGTPFPLETAWGVTVLEIVGGVALIVGAFVVVISIPLMASMIVAMVTVHFRYGFSSINTVGLTSNGPVFGAPGYEINLLYVCGLMGLVLSQDTWLSVDGWRSERRSKGRELKEASLPISRRWMVRRLGDGDRAAVLRLNGRSHPEVWPLGEAELGALLGFGGYHLIAMDEEGNVLGYLLSFPSSCDYDDTEMREFRRRVAEPFVYICQVVIGSEHRRRGIGRGLYDAVVEEAKRTGVGVLCCDVNTEPANPVSLAFHRELGFERIGDGVASNGFGVAFLAKM
ncbi:MAG: GNAT family N-acetyltransferase [Phycisphaerae bacterium]